MHAPLPVGCRSRRSLPGGSQAGELGGRGGVLPSSWASLLTAACASALPVPCQGPLCPLPPPPQGNKTASPFLLHPSAVTLLCLRASRWGPASRGPSDGYVCGGVDRPTVTSGDCCWCLPPIPRGVQLQRCIPLQGLIWPPFPH